MPGMHSKPHYDHQLYHSSLSPPSSASSASYYTQNSNSLLSYYHPATGWNQNYLTGPNIPQTMSSQAGTQNGASILVTSLIIRIDSHNCLDSTKLAATLEKMIRHNSEGLQRTRITQECPNQVDHPNKIARILAAKRCHNAKIC
jgi:hypothetical protein